MNNDETKQELVRLIAEAPQIAPSIVMFQNGRSYGQVTDESLNIQASQRWEIEAAAIISKLASSGAEVFIALQARYAHIKNESQRFHSRSIFVHQIMLLLTSAEELMSSALVSVTAVSSPIQPESKDNTPLSANHSSSTSWKNWGDHPIIITILLICAIVAALPTILGWLKPESPIAVSVAVPTPNIMGDSGQQVNIGNTNGGIVNITQQQGDKKKKAKEDTSSAKVKPESELRELIAQLDMEIKKKKLELARSAGMSVSNFETEGRPESIKSDAYIRIERELQYLNEQRNFARQKLIGAF